MNMREADQLIFQKLTYFTEHLSADTKKQAKVVERFFGSLKNEWLLNVIYLTRGTMKMDVEEYIHYYNYERLHTTLGNLTPINYEKLQSQVSGCA